MLFASLVDDPSSHPERFPTAEEQDRERERLFRLIEDLVVWENASNPAILAKAREEIERSCSGDPPPILDPFCGGGAIPIEAQRLGLDALSGDLNPVAVLVTRAMLEIPPRFDGLSPVHVDNESHLGTSTWSGAQGLAADIRYYGQRVRERALERIGHLYPQIPLPKRDGGGDATVIAWIWARTVQSPDPAWKAHVPLVHTWELSTKRDKVVWIEPLVDKANKQVSYAIRTDGVPPSGTIEQRGGRCIATGTPIPLDHIRAAGRAGGLGQELIAIVAEGPGGRVYVDPSSEHETVADVAMPKGVPSGPISVGGLGIRTPKYGLDEFSKLFTPRQALALQTFSDIAEDVTKEVEKDALLAGLDDDCVGISQGGTGARAYSEAVRTYLALVIDKCADYWSSLCSWHKSKEQMRNTFPSHRLSMAWDFTEANPFSGSSGNWRSMLDWVWKSVEGAVYSGAGHCVQRDAEALVKETRAAVVCTDPPYYDNVGYSDISDFFYVWLRANLGEVWPDELATLLTPKQEELVADPKRFGSKDAARAHFESGINRVFSASRDILPDGFPLTIFYAFKSQESGLRGRTSTGWETFLQGVIDSGLS